MAARAEGESNFKIARELREEAEKFLNLPDFNAVVSDTSFDYNFYTGNFWCTRHIGGKYYVLYQSAL